MASEDSRAPPKSTDNQRSLTSGVEAGRTFAAASEAAAREARHVKVNSFPAKLRHTDFVL